MTSFSCTLCAVDTLAAVQALSTGKCRYVLATLQVVPYDPVTQGEKTVCLHALRAGASIQQL